VRELARLQTFPDEWHFANSWTESRRQLGNAVPVLMAETLGRLIKDEIQRVGFAAQIAERELANTYR
jgi:DNA (cytosine-5)-methyltransferase 1